MTDSTVKHLIHNLDASLFRQQKLWLVENVDNPLLSNSSKEVMEGILSFYDEISDYFADELGNPQYLLSEEEKS